MTNRSDSKENDPMKRIVHLNMGFDGLLVEMR